MVYLQRSLVLLIRGGLLDLMEERKHSWDSLQVMIPSISVSSPLNLFLSTAYAEYILMDASDDYADIMASVQEKIYLSKVHTIYL